MPRGSCGGHRGTQQAPPGCASSIIGVNILLFFLVVGAVLLIYLTKPRQITRHLQEVAETPATETPWGIGTALALITMVFLATICLRSLLGKIVPLANEQAGLLLNAGTEIVAFAVIMAGFLLVLGRHPLHWSLFGWQRSLKGVGYGLLTLLCVTPLVWLTSFLYQLLSKGDDAPQPIIPLMQDARGFWLRLLLVLMASVIAPVVEETLFRGILFRALQARLPFRCRGHQRGPLCDYAWPGGRHPSHHRHRHRPGIYSRTYAEFARIRYGTCVA